jgi:hypothetical protein
LISGRNRRKNAGKIGEILEKIGEKILVFSDFFPEKIPRIKNS